MIKCAIFDLDGTLVNSMKYWSVAPLDYAKMKNLNITDSKSLSETFLSMSLPESAKYFKEVYNVKDSIDKICEDIDSIMENYYLKYVDVKPGILAILQYLDSKGIIMGIATATDRFLVKKTIEKLGIDKYFKEILTSSEVGSSKQKPDIYIKLSETMGFTPDETLIFEDLPYGIISSGKVGFHTIGLYDAPSRHLQDKIRSNAHLYLRRTNWIGLARIKNFIKKCEK